MKGFATAVAVAVMAMASVHQSAARQVPPRLTIFCDDRGCSDRVPAAAREAADAPKLVKSTRKAPTARKALRRPPEPRPKVVPALFRQYGIASFYSGKRSEGGMRTASGRRLDVGALTAAHRTLPFGARVEVLNVGNGRSIVVTITDRGPFVHGRVIDLTPAGARALGFASAGIAKVALKVVGSAEAPRPLPWIEARDAASPGAGWHSMHAPDPSYEAMDVAVRMSAAWFTPGKLFTVRR